MALDIFLCFTFLLVTHPPVYRIISPWNLDLRLATRWLCQARQTRVFLGVLEMAVTQEEEEEAVAAVPCRQQL